MTSDANLYAALGAIASAVVALLSLIHSLYSGYQINHQQKVATLASVTSEIKSLKYINRANPDPKLVRDTVNTLLWLGVLVQESALDGRMLYAVAGLQILRLYDDVESLALVSHNSTDYTGADLLALPEFRPIHLLKLDMVSIQST